VAVSQLTDQLLVMSVEYSFQYISAEAFW